MSNEAVTYLVAISAAVFGLAAWIGLIVAPAWQSYSRVWERIVATFLSLYILAALVGAGVGLGALVIYYWDRIG